MHQTFGVLIAILSSCLGGTAAAVTRYLVSDADPVTLAILRWGIGFLFLLPVTLAARAKWPERRDWPGVMALGFCFFGLFFIFYNIAIGHTTAARASLALSTLPLQTMIVGAILRVEPFTIRKTLGVAIAMVGVLGALAAGLPIAPDGAWIGELTMTGAVLCMAFYNVLSRPFMRYRARWLPHRWHGLGAARLSLSARDRPCRGLDAFAAPQWFAGVYLGVGGALAFIFWVMALHARRRPRSRTR